MTLIHESVFEWTFCPTLHLVGNDPESAEYKEAEQSLGYVCAALRLTGGLSGHPALSAKWEAFIGFLFFTPHEDHNHEVTTLLLALLNKHAGTRQ